MSSCRQGLVLASLLPFSMPGATLAQERLALSPPCGTCAVQHKSDVRLVGKYVDLSPVTHVAESNSGFYLPTVHSTSVVLSFDLSGRYLQTFGKRGEGAGEYRNVRLVKFANDTLYIYDNALGTETALAPSGNLVRTRRVPQGFWDVVPLGGGRLLLNAEVLSRRAVGAPFHVMGQGPGLESSFPNAGGRYRVDERHLLQRSLTIDDSVSFWAAHPTQYELERWTHAGKLTKTLYRTADWFPPHFRLSRFRKHQKPPPTLQAVHRSSDGLIWVLIHVADDRWQTNFDMTAPDDVAFNGNMTRHFDSILEAIDPRSQRVLGSQRYDEYIAGFTTAGRAVVYGVSVDGVPYLDIWTLTAR